MPEPSEHKQIFDTDVCDLDQYKEDDQVVFVSEHDDFIGTLLVSTKNARAIAAWIDAYPSTIEAAKVKVPKP